MNPHPSALARLVRLPSVLTVPGDVLLGAAWADEGEEPATEAALALGSSLLYLGGMALNDWADRELDARERPRRPIPAGEVAPAIALGSAIALTGGAIAVAGTAGGARRLRAVLALAATVWLYDLKMKGTPAGPWTMALARALDVLVGAGRNGDRLGRHSLCRSRGTLAFGEHPRFGQHPRIGRRRRRVSPGFGRRLLAAGPPAAVVGAHTLLITLVSTREVDGADEALAGRALLGVLANTTVAATLILTGPRSTDTAALALACLALYGWAMGGAGVGALRQPTPTHLQRMVSTGVLANMPLQAALLASRGRRACAAALVAAWPAARWAGRRTSVT
ncbi:MAG TPA: UbiA family prenyltransferase [Solirubrobacteraceae bacterium]|nr:UbiA family prenyltransferase [Solirubrobacteraceae bacterium]